MCAIFIDNISYSCVCASTREIPTFCVHVVVTTILQVCNHLLFTDHMYYTTGMYVYMYCTCAHAQCACMHSLTLVHAQGLW